VGESMIVMVDAGNSAIKHRLVAAPAVLSAGGRVNDRSWQMGPILRTCNADASVASLVRTWREQSEKLGWASPSVIGMSWSSVGPAAIREMIAAAYREFAGTEAPPSWTSKPRVTLFGGLHRYDSAYREAAQLGTDRWVCGAGLAALGVMAVGEVHMVVSAGTATTIDLLLQQEKTHTVFQGGWILPGIRLMQESLRAGTRQLDYSLPQEISDASQVPRDSQSAIEQGLGLAQTALMGQLIERYRVSAIWLHGGDTQRWLAYANAFAGAARLPPISVRQDLAFLGLLALWGSDSGRP
jgi:pantothenate kinase type III